MPTLTLVDLHEVGLSNVSHVSPTSQRAAGDAKSRHLKQNSVSTMLITQEVFQGCSVITRYAMFGTRHYD